MLPVAFEALQMHHRYEPAATDNAGAFGASIFGIPTSRGNYIGAETCQNQFLPTKVASNVDRKTETNDGCHHTGVSPNSMSTPVASEDVWNDLSEPASPEIVESIFNELGGLEEEIDQQESRSSMMSDIFDL